MLIPSRIPVMVNLANILTSIIFLLLYKDCYSAKVYKFGDSGHLLCDSTMDQGITWYRNGVQLQKSDKIIPSGATLFMFCLEPSDSGVYTCRDTLNNSHDVNLIVHNPENKRFVVLFNKNRKKCLKLYSTLTLSSCTLNDCETKWSWNNENQLVSAIKSTDCISVNQLSAGSNIFLSKCSSAEARKWQCQDLRVEGTNLMLSNKKDSDALLLDADRPSAWLNYLTGKDLCSNDKKEPTAVILPGNHIVKSDGDKATITCMAFNVVSPLYTWIHNDKDISSVSSLTYVSARKPNVLVIPFAYVYMTGEYTCVVHGSFTTVNATTYIEVFEDPAVIRHSLQQTINVGKETCLSCELYATNDSATWFKNGVLLTPRKFNITTNPGDYFNKFWSYLCIKSVETSDRGEYACGVRGLELAKGELVVYAKPVVIIIKDGDELNCSVSGFPEPRVIWLRNNKIMKDVGDVVTIETTGANYTCLASNVVGTSSHSYISVAASAASKKSSLSLAVIVGCVVAVVILLVILALLIWFWYRRRKQSSNNNLYEDNYQIVRYTSPPGSTDDQEARPTRTHIEYRCSTEPRPQKGFSLKPKYHSTRPRSQAEWEIPRECIQLDQKLGEGQFGQVWKGRTSSRKAARVVAIKMLKENAELKERKSLIDELELMKTMTPHPNIVGLVGCCTRSEPIMMIVEFVPHGDLKEFLIKSRGQTADTYGNLAAFSVTLTAGDLLSFAYQIARGMSYLEKIKCVHRDLAARNILVGDEKTCKIADFGLARDICNENYYRKTNAGRLPLRWMAFESIFNGITTTQSDAWSFGVLVWEIVTLGGNPYPGMTRDILIDALQQGYRMPKPHHCSDELYSIMWDCWQQNPDKRPTFAELTASFQRLIAQQRLFVNTDQLGEEDYVNLGTYEVT